VKPASFLNLDLELRSAEDLAPLASYFEQHAIVLYSGKTDRGFQLTVEPLIGGHTNIGPDACTEELLSTISDLPEQLAILFHTCHTRVFDFGFDSSVEWEPRSVDLTSAQLADVARAGISIRITVYPYRADSDEQGQRDA
jgi:hypothetical protein